MTKRGRAASVDGSRGEEDYKDFPKPPRWVIDNLPQVWKERVKSGKAGIIKDHEMGYMLCTEMAGEWRCWKIFRYFNTLGTTLVELLRDRCMTLAQLSQILAVPQRDLYPQLYYYNKAGLLTKTGPFFCLNYEHPQISLFIKMLDEGRPLPRNYYPASTSNIIIIKHIAEPPSPHRSEEPEPQSLSISAQDTPHQNCYLESIKRQFSDTKESLRELKILPVHKNYKRIEEYQFSDTKESLRINQIAKDLTSEPVLKMYKRIADSFEGESLDPSEVLRRAEEVAGGLSEVERLIIEKLVEWRRTRGRWYVCVRDVEGLREVLNINNTSGVELEEALDHLQELGLVFKYFDRRNRKICYRVDRKLVSQA